MKRDCRHLASDQTKSETVTVTTLDDYCSRHSVGFIDLLKMDVEGYELEVLKGATEVFAAGKVGRCLFEFGGTHIDTRTFVRDFFYFFKEADYELLRVTPAPSFVPLSQYKEFYEQFRTTNFLAIKRDNGVRKMVG